VAKKEVWEPCPRCNSNRVESRGGCFYALMGIGLMGISIWLLFIPIIGITGILFGAVLLLASPFFRNMLQCQDCQKSWKYPYKKEVSQ
jgi:hypothetical protein